MPAARLSSLLFVIWLTLGQAGAGFASDISGGEVSDRSFSDSAALNTSLPQVSPGMLQDDADTGGGTADADAEGDEITRTTRAGNFGDENTWRINFYGAGAIASGGELFGGFVSLSYFIIDDLSIEFELGALGFSQDGPDTFGGNFNVLIRWHFYSQPTWSIFIDAGAGFLKTSDDVPDNGTNFNFTPQAGMGVSFDIGSDWRALVGLRWHHISNASLGDSNPGRDSLEIWAGLSIPF